MKMQLMPQVADLRDTGHIALQAYMTMLPGQLFTFFLSVTGRKNSWIFL
jgi:hypothetical protein